MCFIMLKKKQKNISKQITDNSQNNCDHEGRETQAADTSSTAL